MKFKKKYIKIKKLMCIYDSCRFNCRNKYEHNLKYASIRRYTDKKNDDVVLSSKINWEKVEKIKKQKIQRVARVPILFRIEKDVENQNV